MSVRYVILDEMEQVRAFTNSWEVAHAVIEILVALGNKPRLQIFKEKTD